MSESVSKTKGLDPDKNLTLLFICKNQDLTFQTMIEEIQVT
jgi:hypothetical protein